MTIEPMRKPSTKAWIQEQLRERGGASVILAVVTLGVMLNQCQMQGIDDRLASVDNRQNTTDQKIDHTTQSIEQRIDDSTGSIEKRIDEGLKTQSDIAVKVTKAEDDLSVVRVFGTASGAD